MSRHPRAFKPRIKALLQTNSIHEKVVSGSCWKPPVSLHFYRIFKVSSGSPVSSDSYCIYPPTVQLTSAPIPRNLPSYTYNLRLFALIIPSIPHNVHRSLRNLHLRPHPPRLDPLQHLQTQPLPELQLSIPRPAPPLLVYLSGSIQPGSKRIWCDSSPSGQ